MNILSRLTIKVYRVVYLVIRLKIPSFILALVYMAALHLIIIRGGLIIFQDWVPASITPLLFGGWHFYVTALAIIALNYLISPPFKSIITGMNYASDYTILLIYSGISVVFLIFELLVLW